MDNMDGAMGSPRCLRALRVPISRISLPIIAVAILGLKKETQKYLYYSTAIDEEDDFCCLQQLEQRAERCRVVVSAVRVCSTATPLPRDIAS